MSDTGKSFWETMPGILTGCAALFGTVVSCMALFTPFLLPEVIKSFSTPTTVFTSTSVPSPMFDIFPTGTSVPLATKTPKPTDGPTATLTPCSGCVNIFGEVRYQGKPITDFIDALPDEFFFRDEETGQFPSFPFQYTYNPGTGEYSIYNVPPGKYGISFRFDADGNGWPLPNDFDSWTTFAVNNSQINIQQDIDLFIIIHLISPVNNASEQILDQDNYTTFNQSDLVFTWDAINGVDRYDITIDELDKSSGWLRNVASYSTASNTYQAKLPSSPDNHYYRLSMDAYRNSIRVGWLMIKYDLGFGWDYEFRVKN